LSTLGKDWAGMIETIKRCGVGVYGTKYFMPQKHEHWKFLWAADHIAELEAADENSPASVLLRAEIAALRAKNDKQWAQIQGQECV
jgi:hypothetical protein